MQSEIRSTRPRGAIGLGGALALAGGMIYPLAFSPYEIWALALASFAALYVAISGTVGRWEAAIHCFLFGIGKFGVGAYWIFVSLYSYADVSVVLAATLFLTFLIIVSGIFSLVALFVVSTRYRILDALFFAAGVSIVELALSMPFALSFPWLHLGYALIDTPLSSFAPLGGVWVVSFIGVLSGVAIGQAVKRRWENFGFATVLWVVGFVLPTTSWEEGEEISVALVQGNVPLEAKWEAESWESLLAHHLRLSQRVSNVDLVVWPESAIPANIREIEQQVLSSAEELDGRLVFGTFETMPAGSEGASYNVVATFAQGEISTFGKEQLVPFAEYIPLRNVFGTLLQPLGYPMSSLAPQSGSQPPLRLGDTTLGVSICYEVAFPHIVRRRAQGAELLVVLSEDSWLGDTTGPWQHMQIARMRALELGKYLLRATNDGVTAIVDPSGSIKGTLDRYRVDVLRGRVARIDGRSTVYARFGLVPFAVLILLVIGVGWLAIWRTGSGGQTVESFANTKDSAS